MKNIFIIMAAALAAILPSCSKDDDVATSAVTPESTSKEVTIKLTSDIITKAFFDPSASAETWEKQVNSATIILDHYSDMSSSPDQSIHEVFLASDFSDNSVTISLQDVNVGDVLAASVVANVETPEGIYATRIYEDFIKYLGVEYYNGTFAEVYNGAKRSEGFPLYAIGYIAIEDLDAAVMPLTLSRSVSKIAIETTISDNFNNPDQFPGDLRVDAITAYTSYDRYVDLDEYDTHYQASNKSGDKFQNLFYMAHSNKHEFHLSATYDADGDFTTTDDQTPVSYIFALLNDYGESIELLVNRYYRVSVNINSADVDTSSECDIDISLSVSDWEQTADQNVDIG